MFSMRKVYQTTLLRVFHHKNGRKHCATIANGDNSNKPYPLDGIRVLDLTRIGKIDFFDFLHLIHDF